MTTIDRRAVVPVAVTLAALVAVDVPELGSDPWPFSGRVDPRGLFGPLVRSVGRHWDLGFVRTPAIVAAFLVALVAAWGWNRRSWRTSIVSGVALLVVLSILVPGVVLQSGLRQSTHPWMYVNDSTYQIELGGSFIRDGHDPYDRNYAGTGLERWYPAAGFPTPRRQVALRHFAYFPGTPLTAAAWGVLPHPLDDYRFFVLLCTVGLFFAALAFRGPPALRIALGAALAANPLAARAVWFGTADAPSLLCIVLAFAFLTRRRVVTAAALLGAAVLLKQFALVAVPFFALAVLGLRPGQRTLRAATGAFAAILVAGFVPFLVADPGGVWRDTIAYGSSTYRIIGYGLSSLFLKAGIVDNRYASYPFLWLALVVWLPITAWLVWNLRRSPRVSAAAAAFGVSMFVLLFVSRVFQTSYLVWPLDALAIAVALGLSPHEPWAHGSNGTTTADGRPASITTRR